MKGCKCKIFLINTEKYMVKNSVKRIIMSNFPQSRTFIMIKTDPYFVALIIYFS